jgi:hypothetical protein
VLYIVFGHWEKSYLNTRKNTIFLRVKISIVVKRIATDVLLFFTEFCLYNKQKNTWVLEIPDFFLVLNMISHSFAALTREISCSTLEINLVFPRTHVLFSIYFPIGFAAWTCLKNDFWPTNTNFSCRKTICSLDFTTFIKTILPE